MRINLRHFSKGMKQAGKFLSALVVVGFIAFAFPVEAEASVSTVRATEEELFNHTDRMQWELDLGDRLIVEMNDGTTLIFEPYTNLREAIQAQGITPTHPNANATNATNATGAPGRGREGYELLSRAPMFTAPRESHATNGALREFLLDFIETYIAEMKNEDQGRRGDRHHTGLGRQRQDLSDRFLAGYREAMGRDTGRFALGLNDAGMDIFYDSKNVDFFTVEGQNRGSFNNDMRIVSIAINTIENGVLNGLTPEEIASLLVYEIDGRGRGWEPIMNHALAMHFGVNLPLRVLHLDPRMEIGVSEAAGGIHTLFEAADNGAEAVRDFMNENLRNANQHFNFDYDSWQMARRVDFLIRQRRNTPDGQRATQEFMRRGGHRTEAAAITALRQLQNNVVYALDTTHSPFANQRRRASDAVNRDVALLAEIGIVLEIGELDVGVNSHVVGASVNNNNIPVVDLNNPNRGIIGRTGHFGMTYRVAGN